MSELINLIVVVSVFVLTIKGIIATWFFSGLATVAIIVFAFPLLPIIGFISLF